MSLRNLSCIALGALFVAAPSLSLHAETTTPQSVGLSSERLARVHELVERTIAAGEITGAVTLVARNGQVAYLEAGEGFGLGVRVVTDSAARGTWLSQGSFGWSGVYGTHFWADPKENLVGILLAQTANRTFSSDFENAVMQALLDQND